VPLYEIGGKLGLSRQESAAVATYLAEMKWAAVSFVAEGTITITPLGHQEISKLHLPPWRRWLESNAGMFALIAALAAIPSLRISLISLLFK
jgi:hypothetical protein